jgi:predicted metal-dependent hydrolase
MQYLLKTSTRARNLRITVHSDGSVTLTKPTLTPISKAESFLNSRTDWIQSVQQKLIVRQTRHEKLYGPSVELPRLRPSTKEYKEAVKEARVRVTALVERYAAKGPYTYASISIRNQKTRWGSCSRAGVLSFNYRLIYLTPQELHYLVVHELAHTKHHNHGERFWEEVGRFVPEYKSLRRSLKRYRW